MSQAPQWIFFTLNLIGFLLSSLCIIPLFTSKSYWKFPVRILQLTSFPMAACSLSFMIGIKYMYDGDRESETSVYFCYIQSYLLNFGVQLIYSLAVFYIHLVFQIVYLGKEERELKQQEKFYFAFMFLCLLSYIISNEATGGPTSQGPWCSTGNPIILVFFPYILFAPFSFMMAVQSCFVIRKIWQVKKTLRREAATSDPENSTSEKESNGNPIHRNSLGTSLKKYKDYNLYFRISLMCFALSVSLWVAGVRRGLRVWKDNDEEESIIPYFIYPAAIILESIVILLYQKTIKFYQKLLKKTLPRLPSSSSMNEKAEVVVVQTING